MRTALKGARVSGTQHAKPSIGQARERALDFAEALNAVQITSRILPPVRALRARLLPAWEAWARTMQRAGHPESLCLQDRDDYGPAQAFHACQELYVHALHLCEVSNRHEITVQAIYGLKRLVGLAGLYLIRPHAVIEPTDALQSWLARTDIGEDVPASLFQLPLPAVFLRVDSQLQRSIDPVLWADQLCPFGTQGIYVFETRLERGRELTFMAVRDGRGEADMGHILHLVVEDENEPLISVMRRTVPETESDFEGTAALVELCAKVMLYLQTSNPIRIDEMRDDEAAERLTRVGSKKASRIERKLASRYNRIVIGPAQFPGHAGGEVSPHWRRGHMRMQAHGPQMSLRKLIFIAPTLIRADRLNDAGAVAH